MKLLICGGGLLLLNMENMVVVYGEVLVKGRRVLLSSWPSWWVSTE